MIFFFSSPWCHVQTPPEFDCSFLYLPLSSTISLLMKYHSLFTDPCCQVSTYDLTLSQSSPGKESFMYRSSWKPSLVDLRFYSYKKNCIYIYIKLTEGLGHRFSRMEGKRCPPWNEHSHSTWTCFWMLCFTLMKSNVRQTKQKNCSSYVPLDFQSVRWWSNLLLQVGCFQK